mgnify:CR=1 FL=1
MTAFLNRVPLEGGPPCPPQGRPEGVGKRDPTTLSPLRQGYGGQDELRRARGGKVKGRSGVAALVGANCLFLVGGERRVSADDQGPCTCSRVRMGFAVSWLIVQTPFDALDQLGQVVLYDPPDNFVLQMIVAMSQNVSERNGTSPPDD